MSPLQPAARRPVTILLVILIAVALFLAFRSQLSANEARAAFEQSEKNVVATQANTDRLENLVHEQCEQAATQARSLNSVLNSLIEGAEKSTVFSPTEKATRIKRYEGDKQPITACKKE